MSKNKKGSKSHQEDITNWDEGIVNEKISDVRQEGGVAVSNTILAANPKIIYILCIANL